ncbi:response regulator [Mucilaginibacter sp. L3T2-6]|uniref:response regulator n=1 Tax=Mucilaginibacter sp. L3T2-6 TaxID=3062491 RepID=UPI002676F7AA|nr:response regulator [Mucilaginibacter sp. L3T2-6]MDO3643833.1 response regulator [Mucilaginibacter sp. L3T2-6]MDV6216284.1 response regulator [Mucilaginibacter sp. L3T2-6]
MVNFLMIDDNPIEHIIMQKMFDKFHLFPNAVHSLDGRVSMSLFESHPSDTEVLPDVIFLDLNMPGYSGWDFLCDFEKVHRQIKKKVDVYIISSSVDPNDKQLAEKYDFVKTFVSKPIKTETLLDLHSLYQSDKRAAG